MVFKFNHRVSWQQYFGRILINVYAKIIYATSKHYAIHTDGNPYNSHRFELVQYSSVTGTNRTSSFRPKKIHQVQSNNFFSFIGIFHLLNHLNSNLYLPEAHQYQK